MFLMGKIGKRRRRCLSGCQTGPPLLMPPGIFARPRCLHPPARRPSPLLSTHRSFYQQPLFPSRPPPPPTWSAACPQSGGCPSPAWIPVSYVSRGQRMAASFTGELGT